MTTDLHTAIETGSSYKKCKKKHQSKPDRRLITSLCTRHCTLTSRRHDILNTFIIHVITMEKCYGWTTVTPERTFDCVLYIENSFQLECRFIESISDNSQSAKDSCLYFKSQPDIRLEDPSLILAGTKFCLAE